MSHIKVLQKGILLIGPISPPLGGEALAFKVVYDFLKSEKIEVYSIDKSRFKNSPHFPLINTFYYFFGLFRYSIKCKQIYITSSSNTLGKLRDVITALFANLFRQKIIFHMHSNAYLKLNNNFLLNYFIKKTINSFEIVIVLSEQLKKQLNYINDKKKIITVENALYPNTPDFKISSEDDWIGLKDESFSLLYLSHVLPSKGLFDILEALVLFDSQGYDFVFRFAGSYINEGKLSVKAIQTKVQYYKEILKEKFKIIGFVESEKKWKLLQKSKILLLPTNFYAEGYPISILEAMYFGETIITTKWRAIPDIVESEKNGFFVNYNKPLEILDILKKIYENQNILVQIGYTNHLEALQKYSPHIFKEKMVSIFNEYFS